MLKRNLGFYTILAVVIGDVIGSGIFVKPASIALQCPDRQIILLLWIAGGLVTMMGALTNAEAITMFPETGGQYILFNKMYGSLFGFLYGWASFIVFNTAGIASIAYVASYYFDYVFPLFRFSTSTEQSFVCTLPGLGSFYILEHFGRKMLTIAILIFFSVLNAYSLRQGSQWQKVLTVLKIAGILGIVLIVFLHPESGHDVDSLDYGAQVKPFGFIAALAGVFWCFDGWNNISFIAGEMKDPMNSIWKALVFGLSLCAAVYFLFNLTLFELLSLEEIQKSDFVAASALESLFPHGGGAVISCIVIISVLGAVNGNILSCSRLSYSFFRDYNLWKGVGAIHPEYATPYKAIFVNTAWAIVLIIVGSFDVLTDMLIFVSWFFYGMSALGVLILRKKYPNHARPFKVPLYPWLPIGFVAFSLFYLVLTIYNDVQAYISGEQTGIRCLLGTFLVLLGIPLYMYTRSGHRQSQ